jgi:hypothetical protein
MPITRVIAAHFLHCGPPMTSANISSSGIVNQTHICARSSRNN